MKDEHILLSTVKSTEVQKKSIGQDVQRTKANSRPKGEILKPSIRRFENL